MSGNGTTFRAGSTINMGPFATAFVEAWSVNVLEDFVNIVSMGDRWEIIDEASLDFSRNALPLPYLNVVDSAKVVISSPYISMDRLNCDDSVTLVINNDPSVGEYFLVQNFTINDRCVVNGSGYIEVTDTFNFTSGVVAGTATTAQINVKGNTLLEANNALPRVISGYRTVTVSGTALWNAKTLVASRLSVSDTTSTFQVTGTMELNAIYNLEMVGKGRFVVAGSVNCNSPGYGITFQTKFLDVAQTGVISQTYGTAVNFANEVFYSFGVLRGEALSEIHLLGKDFTFSSPSRVETLGDLVIDGSPLGVTFQSGTYIDIAGELAIRGGSIAKVQNAVVLDLGAKVCILFLFYFLFFFIGFFPIPDFFSYFSQIPGEIIV